MVIQLGHSASILSTWAPDSITYQHNMVQGKNKGNLTTVISKDKKQIYKLTMFLQKKTSVTNTEMPLSPVSREVQQAYAL